VKNSFFVSRQLAWRSLIHSSPSTSSVVSDVATVSAQPFLIQAAGPNAQKSMTNATIAGCA